MQKTNNQTKKYFELITVQFSDQTKSQIRLYDDYRQAPEDALNNYSFYLLPPASDSAHASHINITTRLLEE